jgi:hypothetical protein
MGHGFVFLVSLIPSVIITIFIPFHLLINRALRIALNKHVNSLNHLLILFGIFIINIGFPLIPMVKHRYIAKQRREKKNHKEKQKRLMFCHDIYIFFSHSHHK